EDRTRSCLPRGGLDHVGCDVAARLGVKPAGLPENRTDRLAAQRLAHPASLDGVLQDRKDFAVRTQRVIDVLVGVRQRHVVKAAPENPSLDELLLDERFLVQRIGGLRVEGHHRTAVESHASREVEAELRRDFVVAVLELLSLTSEKGGSVRAYELE